MLAKLRMLLYSFSKAKTAMHIGIQIHIKLKNSLTYSIGTSFILKSNFTHIDARKDAAIAKASNKISTTIILKRSKYDLGIVFIT